MRLRGVCIHLYYRRERPSPRGRGGYFVLWVAVNGRPVRFIDRGFSPGFIMVPQTNPKMLARAAEQHPCVAYARVEHVLPSVYAEKEVAVVRAGLRDYHRESVRKAVEDMWRLHGGFYVAEDDFAAAEQWYRLRGVAPHAVVDLDVADGEIREIRVVRPPTAGDFKLLCIDADFGQPPFGDDSRLRALGMRWEDGGVRLCTESYRTGGDGNGEMAFASEREMLREFQRRLDELDPDIIAAYEADSVTFPGLAHRAACLGLRLRLGRERGKTPTWPFTRRGFVDWKHVPQAAAPGRVVLDLWRDARTDAELKRTDLSLGAACRAALGEERDDVDALWQLASLRLSMLLDWSTRSKVPLADVCRQKHGFMNRMVINDFLTGRALIPSTAEKAWGFHTTDQEVLMENGGLVITPRAGLYRDVAVLDFSSLFPRLFVEHNISPETVNCGHADCQRDGLKVPFLDGFYVCRRRRGFYPRAFEPILRERDEAKARLRSLDAGDSRRAELELRAKSLKLQLVSPYGWLQFPGNPLRSVDANRSIPAFARRVLLDTRDLAEQAGFSVIYADTDSVFISRDGLDPQECRDFAAAASEELDLPLDFQCYAEWALFTAENRDREGAGWVKGIKKSYALIARDGVTVKGFEAARQDRAPVARNVQLHVLELMRREIDDPLSVVPQAVEHARAEARRVAAGNAELGDLPLTVKLQRPPGDYARPPAHVRAAVKLARGGYQVRVGAKITYVKLGPGEAAPVQLVRWPGPYFRESYADDVTRASHHLMHPLGVRRRDLVSAGVQTRLKDYAGVATCRV